MIKHIGRLSAITDMSQDLLCRCGDQFVTSIFVDMYTIICVTNHIAEHDVKNLVLKSKAEVVTVVIIHQVIYIYIFFLSFPFLWGG